jgi:hypothetical protein
MNLRRSLLTILFLLLLLSYCVATAEVSSTSQERRTTMATHNPGVGLKINQTKNKLTIEIDLTKEHGLSKSGKTVTIASSKGNAKLDDGIVLGLNCYKYPES